jgi:translation initiation factor 1
MVSVIFSEDAEPPETSGARGMFPRSRRDAVKDARRGLVYSTGKGRICPKCGWPETDCRCSSKLGAPDEPMPGKIRVNVSVEKRGSGKLVTMIDGLPPNREFLDLLARELKKSCGTGGRTGETFVEIQGDHRERLRELLARKGWTVKV